MYTELFHQHTSIFGFSNEDLMDKLSRQVKKELCIMIIAQDNPSQIWQEYLDITI